MRIVAALKTTAVAAGLVGVIGLVVPASAQAPASSPAADPALAAASAAFEALSEADRRAIQDALVWTGDYNGIVDGHFGKGTRDAIVAFARRTHLPTNGTLDDKARASLISAAAKAKQAVAFTLTSDPRSGVRIGVPLKLLPKKTDLKAGTRYATADGTALIETAANPESQADLAATFGRLAAEAPGHHVTYKILRPDFLVVSGTTANGIFYTRVARGTGNGVAELRGYTLTYPNSLKPQFDVISIAISNSFEPFPAPDGAAAGEVAVPPPPPPHRPPLVASALAVGTDLALSALPAGACATPQVAGHAARISRQDTATLLVLLDVPGLGNAPIPPVAAVPQNGTPVLVLFETATTGSSPPASQLLATAGEVLAPPAGAAAAAINAALQGPASGAAVFDRAGALVGLVAPVPQMPGLVAGIVPRSTYSIVAGSAVASFLSQEGGPQQTALPVAQTSATAAEIAVKTGKSILPVTCGP